MVTFMSLCLIAYVILLPITLHPACRPAVYSVLAALPPTLLLVCSFLISIHCMIWSFRSIPTSSSSNTLTCHNSLILPPSNSRTTPSLPSSNHFSCLLLQFHVSRPFPVCGGGTLKDRERPLTGQCAGGRLKFSFKVQRQSAITSSTARSVG